MQSTKRFVIAFTAMVLLVITLSITTFKTKQEINTVSEAYQDTLAGYQKLVSLLKEDALLQLTDSQLKVWKTKNTKLWSDAILLINSHNAMKLEDSAKFENIEKEKQQVEKIASLKSRELELGNQKLNRLRQEQDSMEAELFSAHQENLLLWQKKEFLNDSLMQIIERTGSLVFKNQQKIEVEYFGEKQNGQATGFGVGIYETGSIYKGNWQHNQRHGVGVFIWKNGDRYEGEFKNDTRNGQGIYYFRSGEKYIGQWRNDLRQGKGKILTEKGEVLFDGYWENDKPIEDNQKDTSNTLFE